MNDGKFSSFPKDEEEALALLYVKNQDLNGKTPEQICALFWDAYYRIHRNALNVRRSAMESLQ